MNVDVGASALSSSLDTLKSSAPMTSASRPRTAPPTDELQRRFFVALLPAHPPLPCLKLFRLPRPHTNLVSPSIANLARPQLVEIFSRSQLHVASETANH